MLSGNELFVVLKLVSGEQDMAVLRSEDEMFVEVESPMCNRTIPVVATNKEHITAHPLCQFTDDVKYVLDKKDVMFIKKMHHIFIPHYLRIVHEHEKLGLMETEERKTAEDHTWEGEKIEERFATFVEGNDPIN
jgi:hypothetical protein